MRIYAQNKYFGHTFVVVNKIPKVKDLFKMELYDDLEQKLEDIKEVIFQVDKFKDMVSDDTKGNYTYYRVLTFAENNLYTYSSFFVFYLAVERRNRK